jgi:tripartite-type tricarboxylate transporter receptor subunit TctC
MRREIARAVAAAATVWSVAYAGSAYAQVYPNKPIRVIVPFPAGASYDTIMRVVGEAVSESVKQPVIVENRPGASAIIGGEMIAKATPDGYTIGMLGNNHTILEALGRKTPFNLSKDFAPIMRIAVLDNVVVTHPSVPAKSLKELIAVLKANPGKYRYGSGGTGGTSHLAAALFTNLAGVDMQHIPYKAGGFAVTGLVGGEVQLMVLNMISTKQHLPAGRLRAYAVAAKKRSEHLPDLPTTAEAGLPGCEASQWYAVVAPAGTPKALLARLEAEFKRAAARSDVRTRLSAQGADAYSETPQALAAFLREDVKMNRETARAAGIKAQ